MPPDDAECPPEPYLAPSLAPLERTVVALALRDPLWSVPRPRRWFRPGPPRAERLQLANPRLESLRRFVILRRHGQDSGDGATTLLNCGFSPGQIREAGRLADLHSGA